MIIEEVKTEKQMLMEQWLEALRSGDFEQGQGAMRAEDGRSEKPKYCCLGVADEVCFSATWQGQFIDHAYQDDMGSAGSLPDERREILELDKEPTEEDMASHRAVIGEVLYSSKPDREQLLIGMNDSGISFEGIAAFIEERGWV
jgi:hypothetical protein